MVIDRKVGREGTTATVSSSSWHLKEGGRRSRLLLRRQEDPELQKFNGSLAPFKGFTTRRRAAPPPHSLRSLKRFLPRTILSIVRVHRAKSHGRLTEGSFIPQSVSQSLGGNADGEREIESEC